MGQLLMTPLSIILVILAGLMVTATSAHVARKLRCLRELRGRPGLEVSGGLFGSVLITSSEADFTVSVEVPFWQRYGVREWCVRASPLLVGDRTRLQLQARGLMAAFQGRRWDRGALRALERSVALSKVVSGDQAFDRAATVRASEPDVARALLAIPEVRNVLLDLLEGKPLVGDVELAGHTLYVAARHDRWRAELVEDLIDRTSAAARALIAAQDVPAVPPRQLTERGQGSSGGAPVGVPLVGGRG